MKLNQELLPNTERRVFQSSRLRCHPNSWRYSVRRMVCTEGDGKDAVDMYEFERPGWVQATLTGRGDPRGEYEGE